MKRKFLYHPTILIPNDWIKTSILYIDKIGSIVPYDFDYASDLNDIENEYYLNMKYLKEREIYEYSRPDQISDKRAFLNELKYYLEKEDGLDKARNSFSENQLSILYKSKIDNDIIDYLDDNGLINSKKRHNSIIEVESGAVELYMSILANHIAELDTDKTSVNTNLKRIYTRLNFEEKHKNLIINLDLVNILPSPSENTSLERICDFRDSRRDELLLFRHELDRFMDDISSSNSKEEMKDYEVKFKEKIEIETSKIERLLNESKITNFKKSISSIVNLKSPTFYQVLMGCAPGLEFLKNPKLLLGTVLVSTTISYINDKNMVRSSVKEMPYSYLHYINDL